ncbi:MAG: peptidoglycan DD-metalloendopeptidase family protein, partial [Thermoleophilia bacterium]|nr:peptidoglycan DD-metalloendopeptidase family protein [Thermoleophilia bacterium]
RLPDAGNCVTVRGADGVYLVSFLHLSAITVKRGASVTAGATIGSVGTTGKRSATAPHLHLGVRLAASGAYVDPLPLLGPRPAVQTPADRAEADAAPLASAPPSVVEQPSQHASSDAQPRTNADANARSQSRGGRNVRGRSRARGQRSGHGAPGAARPALENVHALSIGDTASAAPAVAARGSARESHAPRGRVAPPPLPVKPQSLSSRTAARRTLADSPAPKTGVVDRAARRDSGHRRWPLFLLVSLASAAGALLLSRRRPACDGGRPADDTDRVVIKRPFALTAAADDAAAPKLRVVAR